MKKIYIVFFVVNIENLETLKYPIFFKKHYLFLLFTVSPTVKMKKFLKRKNQ